MQVSHERDSSPQKFHFLVKQRLTQQICFPQVAGKIVQSLIFKYFLKGISKVQMFSQEHLD